ncbi:MAG: carbamoyltransferase HypF, partial [Actinomycetota bacterium]|nr:carbamoyltransferase HypF [Actinomycetota bacterium]
RAIREPWRMACAWLVEAVGPDPELPASLAGSVAPERWAEVVRLCVSGAASPVTTSAGRLFDAVAALCGVRATASYEGQAAVELEALVDPSETGSYPMPALDARPALAAVLEDVASGVELGRVAARFHEGLARATAEACASTGEATAVLSGGVFQNRVLLERTTAHLEEAGLQVLRPERLPPNDGGISYGQAAVATAR